MAFLTPTIQELRPSNTIILQFVSGSLQGFSPDLTLVVKVRASVGANLPVSGRATLTIINSTQYRFEDNTGEKQFEFQQAAMLQEIQPRFRIKNVHSLASTPAPLLLTICTFDITEGPDLRLCSSARFEVDASRMNANLITFN